MMFPKQRKAFFYLVGFHIHNQREACALTPSPGVAHMMGVGRERERNQVNFTVLSEAHNPTTLSPDSLSSSQSLLSLFFAGKRKP